jgi:hypothetical protein
MCDPLKVLLRSVLCVTIVTAIPLPLAAAVVVSEDVPVPGGTDALALALGLDTAPDRARFASEIMRLAYNVPDARPPLLQTWLQQTRTDARVAPLSAGGASADLVPVPLTAAVWSDAVFHRRVPADALFNAILGDRQAALVCRGLTALDDETLAFFAEHPSLLAHVYERDAAVFAVFSSGLHIRGNQIVPAGLSRATSGRDEVAPLWEAVIGEKATRPERFIAELFRHADGRTAYLYDAIAALDPPHAAFALGLWIPGEPLRVARLKALNHITSSAFHEWRPRALPFGRPIYDIAMMLDRVRVDRTGAPLPPAARAVWQHAFNETVGQPADVEPGRQRAESMDAAWLAEAINGDIHQRADRLDQLSFGQRVFGASPPADADAVGSVLREFSRYRMLLLTLERLGITEPTVYTAAIRTASRLSDLDGRRAFVALAQFQGALALVVRLHAVRALDDGHAKTMAREVIDVPIGTDGYAGAMMHWIAEKFRPIEGDLDDAIIMRIAGPRADARTAPRIVWEGQPYRLDLAFAEARRLRRVREKQGGISIDVAVGLGEVVARLTRESPDVSAGIASLKTLASAVQAQMRSDFAEGPLPGVGNPTHIGELIQHVIGELSKIERSKEPRKAAHAVEPLTAAADGLLADALLSIVYAIDIGDPDGTVLLAGDVAHRHDFGLGLIDHEAHARAAWAMPHQEVAPNVPWHVAGSVLGLDIALAPLSLRRTDAGRIGGAPKMTSNERQTFALSVALLNPFRVADAEREAIVAGVGRGRERVGAFVADPASFEAAAAQVDLDPGRRRAIRWTIAHEPARVESMLSATELLYLGGVPELSLDAWGMADLPISGCLCTKLAAPGGWQRLTGRPQLGLLATTVADLNLRVAIVLHELKLPAAIERHVLSAAMQDFIDEVQPTDSDDWLTLVRMARGVTRERIEDYVAAVAADGPLVPDAGTHDPDSRQ